MINNSQKIVASYFPCLEDDHDDGTCSLQRKRETQAFDIVLTRVMNSSFGRIWIRRFSSSNAVPTSRNAGRRTVRIGHVERPLGAKKSVWVAKKYLPPSLSPSTLSHLQWMMQKDALGQDMCLIGPPGSHAAWRRNLALGYAELLQREVQVVTITSDLTESDLKQRRELVSKDSGSLELQFVNAAPVDAALEGRILVLDGIERASRNVLPTLNNLLEHRSMNLEDGRFLVSHDRYQELKESREISSANKSLVPVHPDFRVIATCVPQPPWTTGRPLDPPLRSRFAIRRIESTIEDLYSILEDGGEQTYNRDYADKLIKLAMAMEKASSEDPGKLWPLPTMHHLAAMLEAMEVTSFDKSTLHRIYPVGVDDERLIWTNKHEPSRSAFDNLWDEMCNGEPNTSSALIGSIKDLIGGEERIVPMRLHSIDRQDEQSCVVKFVSSSGAVKKQMVAPCGPLQLTAVENMTQSNFVLTDRLRRVVEAMLQSHASGKDILLLSPPGESKSATSIYFSSLLGYNTQLVHSYAEMTSTDLFLRRVTDSVTGETAWESSALLDAIINGDICILDSVEKLRPDVLASLQSLCIDRDVFLPDGRRVLRADRVENDDMSDPNAVLVHPSFRLIALASVSRDAGSSWFTQDSMSMFTSVVIPSPSDECTMAILRTVNSDVSNSTFDQLLELRRALTDEVAGDCGVSPLSTRNLMRVSRRLNPSATNLYDVLCEVLVADLLPPTQRAALEAVLNSVGIQKVSAQGEKHGVETPKIVVDSKTVAIGDFSMSRLDAKRSEMVPSPKFFDIHSHVLTIKNLLEDWKAGERAFLLLGNQGVGKNMVIDRLCQISNFEREYIQLHRDSTIQQLTLQPSLEEGIIVFHDSPLIRAVKNGLSLVVDEADKAPMEVLAVLKSLVEDGELLLSDGRRISRHSSGPRIIEMHKNFTLWVLANRPGFPFLGNAFFKQIGDCFSTRVVANPDLQSEIDLLISYAPNVDETILRRIAASFADLRRLSDKGELTYPYSTREAVAVAKHLEKFPSDDLVSILHNVLDFDSYDHSVYGLLGQVFQRHGVEVGSYEAWKNAAIKRGKNLEIEFGNGSSSDSTSSTPPDLGMPKEGKWDENNDPHVGGNQWAGGTGGSDTAGLGGRGGPYRLDRGHKVHQVSDEKKAEVSEEAAKAARAMAEKALRKKLDEINMNQSEWDMYQRFLNPIKNDIQNLRAVLNQVEIKESESGWIRRQTHGELDDARLVDGVTGDKFIYKRRGIVDDMSPLQGPKRLCFVMDVSGSMYRFNGYDQRLIRCLEATNLVMEGFQNMQQRFDYKIVGHSGDSPSIPLVNFGQAPDNEKQKMRILQTMIAHSQYCMAGDNTLEAMEQAIADVSNTEEDSAKSLVIAISDANLRRYGIPPRQLGKIMEAGSEHGVVAHCIFIASFGEEAEEIRQSLPVGRSHICMQTNDLPRIVRNILSATL